MIGIKKDGRGCMSRSDLDLGYGFGFRFRFRFRSWFRLWFRLSLRFRPRSRTGLQSGPAVMTTFFDAYVGMSPDVCQRGRGVGTYTCTCKSLRALPK